MRRIRIFPLFPSSGAATSEVTDTNTPEPALGALLLEADETAADEVEELLLDDDNELALATAELDEDDELKLDTDELVLAAELRLDDEEPVAPVP